MKKLLLTCMAFIVFLTAGITPVLAGFSDVDSNPKYAWAKSSIDEMNRRGILTGFPDGTFRPGDPVTKAQFTVMVYRLFPLLRNSETVTIPGVPADHWASREFAELYSTISPIYAADVQNYYDESYTYMPEKNMTRWEVLMTLDALFGGMEGPDISDLKTKDAMKELARVKDVPQIKFTSDKAFEQYDKTLSLMTPKLALIQDGDWLDWAGGDMHYVKAQALYRFMKLGIITPDASGSMYPNREVTRAEIVTILNRMLAAAGEDYAYVKPEVSLSGAYLSPGSSTGFGSNLFYSEPESNIVLDESPEWSLNPGQRLTKVAIQIESEQILDVYVTINGQSTKYTFEQFVNGGGQVTFDVTGLKTFHVRGEARYPELLKEDGNNEVMIHVMDPEMKEIMEESGW